jgi:hypothetical protein
MANYVPVVQTNYLAQGLFSQQKFAQLMASGVLDVSTIEEVFAGKRAGEFVNIPRYAQAAAFARVPIASVSAASFTTVSTNDGKVPVLRDISANRWYKHDQVRAGEDFGKNLGMTIGNKLAKRFISVADMSMQAVLNASGYTSHINDITAATTKTCNVADLQTARAKMGDQADQMTTLLIHSKAWKSLLNDLIVNYKYAGVWSGALLERGDLEAIIGLRNIIVSDDLTLEGGSTTTISDDYYYSYLLGEGALYMAYQRTPEVEVWEDVTNADTIHYEKVACDYVVAPRGFSMATANPTDAQLITPGTWTYAAEDHRNIRIAALKSLES